MFDAPPRQWMCPQCHCLLSALTVEVCPLCSEPLGWIDPDRYPKFREALATSGHPGRQIASRDVRLITEVCFGKEHSNVVGYIDRDASINILDRTLRVRPLPSPEGSPRVEIDSGTKRSVVELHCCRPLHGGLKLTIWQQVLIPEDSTPRMRIAQPMSRTIDCRGHYERTFGSLAADGRVQLLHPAVDLVHFDIARNDKTNETWIAD